MNKRNLKFYFLLCCISCFTINSCKKDDVASQNPGGGGGGGGGTTCTGQPGVLFTAVKTMMSQNCVSCHNNSNTQGGMNWTVDCNIVANSARIKVRAVDQGTMPPTGSLSQVDKDKITAWINAGGRLTD